MLYANVTRLGYAPIKTAAAFRLAYLSPDYHRKFGQAWWGNSGYTRLFVRLRARWMHGNEGYP